MTAEEVLALIAKETSVCTKCELHYSRKNAVPGEGPSNAELFFIGEVHHFSNLLFFFYSRALNEGA